MVAVLFTQFAIAAYSCPASANVMEAVSMAVPMPDCQGMSASGDPAQPQLCKAHCTNEGQSSARAVLPDLQPNPASLALLVRVIGPMPRVPLAATFTRTPPLLLAAESLPLYLSLHVLRN